MPSSSSLSSALWGDPEVRSLARQCLLHPFVTRLADGTLPLEAFKCYVGQDAFFLQAFSSAYAKAGLCASAAGLPQKVVAAFAELRAGIAEELKMHASYAAELGVSLEGVTPLPAGKAYTDYLLLVGSDGYDDYCGGGGGGGEKQGGGGGGGGGGVADGVDGKRRQVVSICAALAPCMRLYAFLGQALAAAGAVDGAGPTYSRWVKEYSSAEMEGLAAKLEGILDTCAGHCSEEEEESKSLSRGDGAVYRAARRGFVRAMRYELAFFAAPLEATSPSASGGGGGGGGDDGAASSEEFEPRGGTTRRALERRLLAAAQLAPPRVLIVAGSDSGGGAGVQADIKACAAAGVFSTTAITAVTAQNTRGVQAVHVLPAAAVDAQLESVLSDIGADVVKTGMLATAEIVRLVADRLASLQQQSGSGGGNCLVVVDPVMVSTSGHALLDADAVGLYRSSILPAATVLTPNIPEAQLLLSGSNNPNEPSPDDDKSSSSSSSSSTSSTTSVSGGGATNNEAIKDVAGMEAAARALAAMGPKWVLVKGGHLANGNVDRLEGGAAASRWTCSARARRGK